MRKYILATIIFCLSLLGSYNTLASQSVRGSTIHDSDHAAEVSQRVKGKVVTYVGTNVLPDEQIKKR